MEKKQLDNDYAQPYPEINGRVEFVATPHQEYGGDTKLYIEPTKHTRRYNSYAIILE